MSKNFLYLTAIITILMEFQASADKNCQNIVVLNQSGYSMGFRYTDCNGNKVSVGPVELLGERKIQARLNEPLAAGTWDHFNKWIDTFGYDNVVHDAPHAPAYLICKGTIGNPSCEIKE